MTNLLGQIESGPAKLCGQFAGLPLLDDIRLFRAVVLVDQFLVALPDQASVIRTAILRAPFADEFLEQFAVFRLQLVCGEQSETERIVERVVDGAVLGHAAEGTRPVRVSTMRMRHPSPAARAIRNNPAPTTTAPMARATRSPAGARRSTVMPAATTAMARRSMTPMTRRIAIRPAQQWLQWSPRRRPCRQAVPASAGSVRPRPGAALQQAR